MKVKKHFLVISKLPYLERLVRTYVYTRVRRQFLNYYVSTIALSNTISGLILTNNSEPIIFYVCQKDTGGIELDMLIVEDRINRIRDI